MPTFPNTPRAPQRRRMLPLAILAAATLLPPLAAAIANPRLVQPPPAHTPAVAAAPAPAAVSAHSIADVVAARLDAEVEAQGLVGISLAVVEGDVVAHTFHRGFEDREKQVPASDKTMYRWASIAKPLTAVAALQLAQSGKLDLDADIRTLIPEFPDRGQTITPRQLLCHQGGIVHYMNGLVVRTARADLNGRYIDIIDALDMFKDSPLVCEPGTKFSYTTHGYILLGAAVQRAGGAPFPDQVTARIAAPAGMITLRPDYQWEEIPHRAVGYRKRAGQTVPSTNTDVSWKLAGGGYISTVGDLARFAIAMMNDTLIARATRDEMFTSQPTADGTPTTYGLGFSVGAHGPHTMISHSGSQEKARTLLAMLPDQDLAIAIMCNTEGANLVPLARDILTIMLESATVKGADAPE